MKYLFKLNYFNRLKLLIIIIFYSFPVFSQNAAGIKFKDIEPAEFIAAYSLTYKLDSLNLDNVRNQEMWLFIGKNTSHFVSKSYYLDTQKVSKIKSRAELVLWLSNRGPYESRSLYHIYKNYPKGKMTFTETTINGTFKYEENFDDFNWELTQDTATIGSYPAQKAICNYGGRTWIAWFSSEIPFNDGPYKFNGLPGLIIKIYDSREHYVFELSGLEVADQDLMIQINDYEFIQTTKEIFFKTRKASRNNIATIVKMRGKVNKASQDKAVQVAASRNNHIELKIDKKKE